METEPPASCRLRWKRNRPDSCRLPWETYPPSFFVACDEMSRVLQKKNKKDKSESSNTNHCLYRLRRREYLAVVVRPYLPLLDAPPLSRVSRFPPFRNKAVRRPAGTAGTPRAWLASAAPAVPPPPLRKASGSLAGAGAAGQAAVFPE